MRDGFYWPTLFRDVHTFVRKCFPWKKISGKEKRVAMPLKEITIEIPFTQWGHSYIVTINDYFTRWHEAIDLK